MGSFASEFDDDERQHDSFIVGRTPGAAGLLLVESNFDCAGTWWHVTEEELSSLPITTCDGELPEDSIGDATRY